MFPAATAFQPTPRRMCAINAVVVLLPLVPVTQIVRHVGASANHRLSSEVNRTPSARARNTSGS